MMGHFPSFSKEDPMKCPVCGKELFWVNIYGECYQHGYLEGNRVVSYGAVKEVLETIAIECPECAADLSEVVEEL